MPWPRIADLALPRFLYSGSVTPPKLRIAWVAVACGRIRRPTLCLSLFGVLPCPGSITRLAIMAAANAIVIMHNHPSGESTPSEADIKVTRDLIRAGQLLKLEVLDHVIVGQGRHSSLRELGYFYQ